MMLKPAIFLFILLCFMMMESLSMVAQSWNFIKEKDGVRIYTRKETGKTLKSYMGVADIRAPADRVFALIEDVNHTEWWDKNFNRIKVLKYVKNSMAQYYLVYDLPWPVTDRDLCVDVTVTIDPATGVRKIAAAPLPGVVPEDHDMIRIREYHQTWTIRPAGDGVSHVVLEGYVDPAGTIPDWLSNMLIVDSPVKAISGIKERLEKK
jgi:hypothetical protein